MVTKDRSEFRKWEKKGGKRRSATHGETGREIRLQRFSAGVLHLSLGSPTWQSLASAGMVFISDARTSSNTHTQTHTHSIFRKKEKETGYLVLQLFLTCLSNFHCAWVGTESSGPIGDSLHYPIWHLKFISSLFAKTTHERAYAHSKESCMHTQTFIYLWHLSGVTMTIKIAKVFIKNPSHYLYEKSSLCACYLLTTCHKRVSLGACVWEMLKHVCGSKCCQLSAFYTFF